jgi:hypothetical protein
MLLDSDPLRSYLYEPSLGNYRFDVTRSRPEYLPDVDYPPFICLDPVLTKEISGVTISLILNSSIFNIKLEML